jgi:hypothetical protein
MSSKQERFRIAVLGDYQHVALSLADWSAPHHGSKRREVIGQIVALQAKVTPDFSVIERGTVSVISRSFYTTVKANTRNTLIATYAFARRNGWDFSMVANRCYSS